MNTIRVLRWRNEAAVRFLGLRFAVPYYWPHYVWQTPQMAAPRQEYLAIKEHGVIRTQLLRPALSPRTKLTLYEAAVAGESFCGWFGMKRWFSAINRSPSHETGVAQHAAVLRNG